MMMSEAENVLGLILLRLRQKSDSDQTRALACRPTLAETRCFVLNQWTKFSVCPRWSRRLIGFTDDCFSYACERETAHSSGAVRQWRCVTPSYWEQKQRSVIDWTDIHSRNDSSINEQSTIIARDGDGVRRVIWLLGPDIRRRAIVYRWTVVSTDHRGQFGMSFSTIYVFGTLMVI